MSLDSGLLANLGALTELRLERNHLRSIAPGAFDSLGNLSTLTLSGNLLESLPPALFLHVSCVTRLTLFENPLEELPEVLFGEMAGLRELWLNGTNLRTLPAAAFRNLSGLQTLGLTRNPLLSALPRGLFHGLTELRVLALHTNALEALPEDALRGLGRLRQVSLRHNRLRALPRTLFRNLSSLVTVQLEHNQLKTLPGDVFAALPQLTRVLLGHNPWLCDCGLWPFLQWLRHHLELLGPDEPPQCKGPESRASLTFWELLQGDQWCPDPRGLPPDPPIENALKAPDPTQRPNNSQSWAWVQLVARGESPDNRFYWNLYILLLIAQATIAGFIVFAMIKIGRLFRTLIREELLFEAMGKSSN